MAKRKTLAEIVEFENRVIESVSKFYQGKGFTPVYSNREDRLIISVDDNEKTLVAAFFCYADGGEEFPSKILDRELCEKTLAKFLDCNTRYNSNDYRVQFDQISVLVRDNLAYIRADRDCLMIKPNEPEFPCSSMSLIEAQNRIAELEAEIEDMEQREKMLRRLLANKA